MGMIFSISYLQTTHRPISVTIAADAKAGMEGFTDENNDRLTFTLPLGERTVSALLRLANAYRVKPIREIALTPTGEALEGGTVLQDEMLLWAKK